MKTSVETPDPLHKMIQVEIPWEMIADELDQAYRKLAGEVHIKGFRKGKVPRGVLRQRFGKQVQEDVLNRLVGDSYEAALIQNRIRAVSKPELERGSFTEGEPYQYTARVEVTPEIEIKETSFEIEKPAVEVEDEKVTEEIDKLRDEKAILIPIDGRTTARKGDTAVVDYSATREGKSVEGGSQTNHPLQLGSGKALPGFEDHVVGMEVGEEKEFDLEFPKDWGPPMLAGKTVQFKVSLKALKNREVPGLTDEFVEDLGKEDVKSVKDLEKLIREQLLEQKQAEADREVKDKLIDELIEKNPFSAPPSLVLRQQDNLAREMELYLSQQGINLEKTGLSRERMKKDLRERAEREIKTALLLTAIAERDKIKVGEDEVEAHLEELAVKSNTNLTSVKAFYESEDQRQRLMNQLLQDKVLDYLLRPSNIQKEAAEGDSQTEPAGEEK